MDNIKNLVNKLSLKIPKERIITNEYQCLAYGTDASFYRLVPKVVLRLQSLDEVIFSIHLCNEQNIPFTFRAAGTSLSGQAVSNSVLFTLTDDWCDYRIHNNGEKITLQPGVIGANANQYLEPFNRKIGPDPASINTCKIGGIVANNASGMCCGTAQNSYKTIDRMKIVFIDGTILDTGDISSIESFRQSHANLILQVEKLCQETLKNTQLSERIRHKYRLKNTTGYSLNALIDFDDPIRVIEHLMIGSEGTLGFIAEVTYNTVIEYSHKASALIVFDSIEEASKAVTALSSEPVAAVEMMDGRALRSVANKPGLPSFIWGLDLESTALLIESHGSDENDLHTKCNLVMNTLSNYKVIEMEPFTSEKSIVTSLWNIRKGMFPAVGAVRETGTTVIIEDVAFPIAELATGVRDLQGLFNKYNYTEAIIFGHALEGNLHFVFTQKFDTKNEINRYAQFMDEVAELVAIKYQGSLKAEHGTGRNMAPYVEMEWGKDGYLLMKKIKELFDPRGLLNPGVIINDNPNSHISDLKEIPTADELIDKCIECGFCEPVCPSRTLTLSPRQRIVLYRELQRRRYSDEKNQLNDLEKLFEYQGIDTCAATGLCADRCPVEINTGDLIKKLRKDKYKHYMPIARWTSNHFSTTSKISQNIIKSNHFMTKLLGESNLGKVMNGLRRITSKMTPYWIPEIPKVNSFNLLKAENEQCKNIRKVVYFPSCASRSLGAQNVAIDKRSLTEVTFSLLNKADFEVILPTNINEYCCGMPYESKGMSEIANKKLNQLESVLWDVTNQGEYPVIMDTSPCHKNSLDKISQPIEILDVVQFANKYLLNYLDIIKKQETIMLHITCSSRRLGLDNELLKLAQACVSDVILPKDIYCCGWAGDKGFTTPELNAAAISSLRRQVPASCSRGFSNSLTCEIGLSHHSGIPYQSILYLLDEVSLAKE